MSKKLPLLLFAGLPLATLAQGDAGSGQYRSGRFERPVDVLGRQARQLGHVTPHVVAVGIELLALERGVEDAKVGLGVGAAAR